MRGIISILFFCTLNICSYSQKDSLITTKYSENIIEIKTLRHKLFDDNSGNGTIKKDSISTVYVRYDLIPKPPHISNGIVIIKDRLDKLLAFYLFSDSVLIQEDHYREGVIEWQEFTNPLNLINIQKYYWNNGNLKTVVYYNRGKEHIYNYNKEGILIIPNK